VSTVSPDFLALHLHRTRAGVMGMTGHCGTVESAIEASVGMHEFQHSTHITMMLLCRYSDYGVISSLSLPTVLWAFSAMPKHP
jgi:hypothetical protein